MTDTGSSSSVVAAGGKTESTASLPTEAVEAVRDNAARNGRGNDRGRGGRKVYHKSGRGRAFKEGGTSGGDRELNASARDAEARAHGASQAAKELKNDLKEAEKEIEHLEKVKIELSEKLRKQRTEEEEAFESKIRLIVEGTNFTFSERALKRGQIVHTFIVCVLCTVFVWYRLLSWLNWNESWVGLVESAMGCNGVSSWSNWLIPLMALWAYWLSGLFLRTTVRYRYGGTFHQEHADDRRPDSSALLPGKHRARYGMVAVSHSHEFFGRIRVLFTDVLYWLDKTSERRDLFISYEMAAQLATDHNLSLTSGEVVAWERINSAARSLQTVNYDRFLALQGRNVKQDTCLYVFALYRKMMADCKESFPMPVLP